MSGSEMGSREQFPLGFHKPQPPPQPQPQPQSQQLQSMRLDFTSDGGAVYKTAPTFHQPPTVAAHVNGGEATAAVPQGSLGLGQVSGSSTEPLKRKRGRPRKYGPEAAMSLAVPNTSPPPPPPPHHQVQFPSAPVSQATGPVSQPTVPVSQPTGPAVSQPAGPFSPVPPPPSASVSSGSSKKKRGRPLGSVNKHHTTKKSSSTGSAGSSFTPHVITVKAGEDLSSRIVELSQNGPRNVCILSANGAISAVTLRQPATSGGAVNYEGRFEILALSGSLLPNANGSHDRLGGLSVSLSGPDGRVLGGGVAGPLVAASPVQLVLGSFLARKEVKYSHKIDDASAPTATAGQSSSPSGGTLSESSGGSGSPFNQSSGACNNNNPPQGISGMPWK